MFLFHVYVGDVTITIDGPTKTDFQRKDNTDRTEVSFMPMTPGVYNIVIKYKGKEIKGSPFASKVSGTHDFPVMMMLVKKVVGLRFKMVNFFSSQKTPFQKR